MQGLLLRIGTASDATKKGVFWHYILKNILPKVFFKFRAKKVLCSLGHVFNKVNRGIVQKPDEVRT